MKADFTLHLWNIAVKPARMVLKGEVINIAGTECAFIGTGLDESAYFWLGPGRARFMVNDELWAFGLAVISEYQTVRDYIGKRNGKPA